MPGRPRRRRTVPAAVAPRRRRPAILVGIAVVVAGVLGALAAVNLADTDRTEAPQTRTGEIYRAQYLILRLGASRTQVRSLLGPPRSTVRRDGRDCWLYDPRSGRRGAYRLCFSGNFLQDKTTVPG